MDNEIVDIFDDESNFHPHLSSSSSTDDTDDDNLLELDADNSLILLQNSSPQTSPVLLDSILTRLKKSPEIRVAINKLLLLREEEDKKRTQWRLNPLREFPKKWEHPNADCCPYKKEGEPGGVDNEKIKAYHHCGPFLSCSLHHSRSNDYQYECEDIKESETKSQGQGMTPRSTKNNKQKNPSGPESKSSTKTVNKCKNCPQKSPPTFPEKGELWYEEYKYQITYGRIPPLTKKQMKTKIKAWLASDDYKERMKWMSNKSKAEATFQSRMEFARVNNGEISTGVAVIKRLSSSKEGGGGGPLPLYGPAAIASISGSGSSSARRMTKKNKNPQQNKDDELENVKKGPGKCLEPAYDIPWPPDNFRYYDDYNTDPVASEYLAKTPFTFPTTEVQGIIDQPQPQEEALKVLQEDQEDNQDALLTPLDINLRPPPQFEILPTTIMNFPINSGRRNLIKNLSSSSKALEYVVGYPPTPSPRRKMITATLASLPPSNSPATNQNILKTLNPYLIPKSPRPPPRTSRTKPIVKPVESISSMTRRMMSMIHKEKEKVPSRPLSRPSGGKSSRTRVSTPIKIKPSLTTKGKSKPSIRRFSQTITTLPLPTPRTKDKINIIDDIPPTTHSTWNIHPIKLQ